MLASHVTDVVTVERRVTARDPLYGNVVESWSPWARGRASIQGVASIVTDETDLLRQTVESRLRIITDDPRLFGLAAEDRVVRDGLTFKVDGQPVLWKRSGRPHHVEAFLERVTG